MARHQHRFVAVPITEGREQIVLDAIELYGKHYGALMFNLTDAVAVDKLLIELGKDENFGKIPKVSPVRANPGQDAADIFIKKTMDLIYELRTTLQQRDNEIAVLRAEKQMRDERIQRNLDLKFLEATKQLEEIK